MNVQRRDQQFLTALSSLKPKTPEWGTPEHAEWLREVSRRAFRQGDALDINAIDATDPVHLKNPQGEADYDGDGGREWRDSI